MPFFSQVGYSVPDMSDDPDEFEEQQAVTKEEYAAQAFKLVRAAVKGNGLKPGGVELLEFEGDIAAFDAMTKVILKSEVVQTKVPGKVTRGQLVDNPSYLSANIEKGLEGARKSSDSAASVRKAVLASSSKGFAVKDEVIPMNFLAKEYVCHVPCQACGASGRIKCVRCKGTGFEICPRCKGQGFEICKHCRGSGEVNDPNGGRKQCNFCHGQGKVPCNFCRQKGRTPCSVCKTKGYTVCTQCGGKAWTSIVATTKVSGVCNFSYDHSTVPDELNEYINTVGTELKDHVKFKAVSGKNKPENGDFLSVSYDVLLPYAHVTFSIGKDANMEDKEVKAVLFGKKAKVIYIDSFVDELIKRGADDMENAALTKGHATELIKKAVRYRTVKEAAIVAAAYLPNKAVNMLLRHNPVGLSKEMAEKLVFNADKAIIGITRVNLIIAIATGALLSLILPALYFLTMLRYVLYQEIASDKLMMAADGAVIVASLVIGYMLINFLKSKVKKSALKKLGIAGRKSKRK